MLACLWPIQQAALPALLTTSGPSQLAFLAEILAIALLTGTLAGIGLCQSRRALLQTVAPKRRFVAQLRILMLSAFAFCALSLAPMALNTSIRAQLPNPAALLSTGLHSVVLGLICLRLPMPATSFLGLAYLAPRILPAEPALLDALTVALDPLRNAEAPLKKLVLLAPLAATSWLLPNITHQK